MKRPLKLTALFLAVIMLAAVSAGCSGSEQSSSGQPTQTDQTGTHEQTNQPEPSEQPEQSEPFEIGIIQYMDHVALDDARKGFVDALKDNGYVDGEKIKIDLQNAQGDQSNLSTISDRFVSNKVDLVLAIATPAAQSIAGKTTGIPILATAITDFVSAKLVNSNEAPGGNVSGTTDMNPIKEQMDLLVKLVPDAKTVGVVYCSSEDNSILQAGLAKAAIEKMGLTYAEATVSNTNDVQQAVQSIVDKVDAIYLPTDNVLATAMPTVYGVSVQSKTPVICGESGMVDNGGLATLGINYYDLGYQTGLMAVKIIKGEAEPSTMPIESPSGFDFAINGNTAKEIDLEIPADLQQYVK